MTTWLKKRARRADWRKLAQALAVLALALSLVLPLVLTASIAHAAEEPPPKPAEGPPDAERLQVNDPFLEMHTGPGRGWPVFFVVERHQWIVVELRHTDWYRVRAEGGQVGWVQRGQLLATLTETGSGKGFRDLLLQDYLGRRLEFGGAWGRFKTEPMLKLWLQYRLADAVGVEAALGQVQGVFSGTDFWHLSLTSEPWSDQRFSPFLAVGLGKLNNVPNSTLVDATTTNAKLGVFTLGLRWHLSDRFVARVDGSLYTGFVSASRSTEYRALSAGIGFFF